MPASRVPFTITYRKQGTSSPVFLAGSFTDPPWLPQKMQPELGEDGQSTFKAQIHVEPGKEYQFKFKIGDGEWWVLDEDTPIGMSLSPHPWVGCTGLTASQ